VNAKGAKKVNAKDAKEGEKDAKFSPSFASFAFTFFALLRIPSRSLFRVQQITFRGHGLFNAVNMTMTFCFESDGNIHKAKGRT